MLPDKAIISSDIRKHERSPAWLQGEEDKCRLSQTEGVQVEMANMNRLFFRPEQAGMTKTDAAAQTLAGINPDVALESFTANITTLQAGSPLHLASTPRLPPEQLWPGICEPGVALQRCATLHHSIELPLSMYFLPPSLHMLNEAAQLLPFSRIEGLLIARTARRPHRALTPSRRRCATARAPRAQTWCCRAWTTTRRA